MSATGSEVVRRRLLVAVLRAGWSSAIAIVCAMTIGGLSSAGADVDDDDDDDDDLSSRTTSSTVEMWPPASIDWPPLRPDGSSDDAPPIVIVGALPEEPRPSALP